MTVHPRALAIDEPRPKRPVWVCSVHGELPPGVTVCPECSDDAA